MGYPFVLGVSKKRADYSIFRLPDWELQPAGQPEIRAPFFRLPQVR
ncbi:hypothetical protein GCWU000324_01287 [Kingella oralis ATCC 51147]|uniref:Uncharacterized protein n=1 Tax=Kingella oralis ATCC 51147 TaxID=629741 RepID=C4GGL9_9NEIS|nr:hypothetical protein GCWU000324_01287 [Kingella oralis ATCC 51147]